MAVGAALLHPLARKARVPPAAIVLAAAVFPAAALAITAGSMGRSHVPDSLVLLFLTTGLLPAGVVLGVAVAWTLTRAAERRRPVQA